MSKKTSSAPQPDDSWRSESDHRTLMDAESIKTDPSRLSGVKAHQKKQMKSLARVGASLGKK